jgi:hypothetical protein
MNDVQEVKQETEQVSFKFRFFGMMQKYQPTSDLGFLEIFNKLK